MLPWGRNLSTADGREPSDATGALEQEQLLAALSVYSKSKIQIS